MCFGLQQNGTQRGAVPQAAWEGCGVRSRWRRCDATTRQLLPGCWFPIIRETLPLHQA